MASVARLTESDVIIRVEGKSIHAHRWVLSLRGHWGESDLTTAKEIVLEGMSYKVAMTILKWVYTDILEDTQGITFMLEVLRGAHCVGLVALKNR